MTVLCTHLIGDNGPSSLNTIPSGVLPPLDQQPSYDEYQHQQYSECTSVDKYCQYMSSLAPSQQ